jgi:hypothetical protein
VHLFHYHLVTSRVREVEARYIGKLGFDLIARHGRIGEDLTSYEAGVKSPLLDGRLGLVWGDALAVVVALALFAAGRWVFLRLSPHFEDFV